MNDSDNKIDKLIQSHLGRELDRHLGRCERAFAAELLREPARPRSLRIMPRYWAAAAVLLVVASVASFILLRDALQRPIAKNKINEERRVLIPDEQTPPLMPVAQLVAWRTLDDGTVMMNGDVPLRRLRRQVVERTRWYDPKHKMTVELSVPQEQEMIIGHW